MIRIKETLCTGCGTCLEVCPTGALSLANGLATVDQSLCAQCEACIGACPEQAIESVASLALQTSETHPVQVESQVIHMTRPAPPSQPQVQPASWPSRVVPVVTGALVAIGRELPRILPPLLDILDGRRQTSSDVAQTKTSLQTNGSQGARGGGGGGRQRRRRRRGR
jgi:NAD-dependent dihydropyrimidine dehydrogenase PreA subunit